VAAEKSPPPSLIDGELLAVAGNTSSNVKGVRLEDDEYCLVDGDGDGLSLMLLDAAVRIRFACRKRLRRV
jgi:hypothetical protein